MRAGRNLIIRTVRVVSERQNLNRVGQPVDQQSAAMWCFAWRRLRGSHSRNEQWLGTKGAEPSAGLPGRDDFTAERDRATQHKGTLLCHANHLPVRQNRLKP